MYVYFIEAYREKNKKIIKIGKANNPEQRLADLQTGSPIGLRLMGKIKCKSELHAKQVEKLAHRIFAKQRRHGEWFRLSYNHMDEIINMIKTANERQEQIDAAFSETPHQTCTLVKKSNIRIPAHDMQTRP